MTHPNQNQTHQGGTPWTDFNNAAVQQDYDLIPKGTLVKVRMTIKAGGYDEPHMGWTDGWATRSETGAAYLNAEFVVLDGPFAKRKIWSLIGLHSPKGPTWGDMGRTLVRAILASARGIRQDDISPPAVLGRRLNNIGELHSMEFVARIGVETDSDGEERNAIKAAVTPEHKQYQELMSVTAQITQQQQTHSQQAQPQQGYQQGQPAQNQNQGSAQQNSYEFQQPSQDQCWNGN